MITATENKTMNTIMQGKQRKKGITKTSAFLLLVKLGTDIIFLLNYNNMY